MLLHTSFTDETGENSYSYPQYDNESLVSDQFQGECAYSDGEDSENLVCQPCRVWSLDPLVIRFYSLTVTSVF